MFFIFLFTIRNFHPKFEEDKNTADLPDYYNFFEDYPECEFGNIFSVCNASHVFTVLKTISHRFCRKLQKSIILSSSYLLKCDIINEVCHGGCQTVTYKFFEKNGVSDINCHPWQQNTKTTKKKIFSPKKNQNNDENGNKKQQQNRDNGVFGNKANYDYQTLFEDKGIKSKDYDNEKNIVTPNQVIKNFFEKDEKEREEFGNFDNYMMKQYEMYDQKKENFDQNNNNPQFNEMTKYSHSFCTKCTNEEIPFKLYKTKLNSTRRLKSVAEMKKAIFERGPITVTLATDNNFRNYKGGIYTSSIPHTTEAGDYTIELIGWGSINSFDENKKIHNYNIHHNNEFIDYDTLNNDDNYDHYDYDDAITQSSQPNNQYWIGLDNQNDEWGENGMIKILMGSNQGLVESFAYEAEPE